MLRPRRVLEVKSALFSLGTGLSQPNPCLATDDVHVRRRLTLREVRESFISELLRRFGVSGRKRSYQTLLVAARSSRRPFSFASALAVKATIAARTCRVDEQPHVPSEFPPGAKACAKPRILRPERSRGGLFPDRPANRHSEVHLVLARPGSGWAANVNFSNINKGISTIRQSHQWRFTTEYADILIPGKNS